MKFLRLTSKNSYRKEISLFILINILLLLTLWILFFARPIPDEADHSLLLMTVQNTSF